MRDLLYLSRDKLEGIHVPPRRLPLAGRELEVSILGTGVHVGPAPDMASATQVTEKLAKVAKGLRKRAKEASDPSLRAGEWFFFDQELEYGTFPLENGSCAFFFHPEVTSGRDGLIMCGSARNLTDRTVETASRYSELGTLDHLIATFERDVPRDARPVENMPRLVHIAAWCLEVIRRGYRPSERTEFPAARLSGLARALFVCPDGCQPKITLGTPLYVEFGPWNPKW
jgi:hypothetical protein